MKRSNSLQGSTPAKKVKQDPDTASNGGEQVKCVIRKGKAAVDSLCTEKVKVAHVYCEGDDVYDVMLNQTNLHQNNNKYYICQLLEDDNAPNYSVWFRWGRVGKTGQNKLETFGSNLVKAKDSFKKKFYDKTLNSWEDRANFEKNPGKYDLVELDYGVQEEDIKEEDKDAEPIESSLPKPVQLLMQLICDISNMEKTMAELKYDSRKAPLGKLSKTQIRAGYVALDKISKCLKDLANLNSNGTEAKPEDKTEQETKTARKKRPSRQNSTAGNRRKIEDQLLMACNEFYTRIPHDFGMRIPPMIRTMEEVKSKIELLEALDDIEFAINIMKKDNKNKENVIDTHYRRLSCDIKPLDSSNDMYKLLDNYLTTNRGSTHSWYRLELLEIFECAKPSESSNFKDLGNKMLLWHGSRLTNWVGILGRGLQIAPPEAPVTGYMFGKGVYFADCSTKSANYVYPTQTKNVGLMALCEVSLGCSRELFNACYDAHNRPSGTHSVKGMGKLQPDSKTWKTIENNLVVPVGNLIQPDDRDVSKCCLQFNEFVVYDVHQIRLRYLLKVKFNFN